MICLILSKSLLPKKTLVRRRPSKPRKLPTKYANIINTQTYDIETFIGSI
jgi:hypothetical protein